MKYKYQLVLQFPFSGSNDYDALVDLENELGIQIGDHGIVDGHDAGSDEMNIFIHTNNPADVFSQAISGLASNILFARMRAAYRPIGKSNYTTLWPKEFKGQFTVS